MIRVGDGLTLSDLKIRVGETRARKVVCEIVYLGRTVMVGVVC